MRDVFETGDMWFRTGDLMKKDELGYFYFVDRIGDTFRWKGENVATNEVSEALLRHAGIQHANVYGVRMPETDGRAGMAAITADVNNLDMTALAAHVDRELPVYARPIFLRLQADAETTGTFKYKKVDLVKEGYSLDEIDEPVFVRRPGSDRFEPLTPDLKQEIDAGNVKY